MAISEVKGTNLTGPAAAHAPAGKRVDGSSFIEMLRALESRGEWQQLQQASSQLSSSKSIPLPQLISYQITFQRMQLKVELASKASEAVTQTLRRLQNP